MMGRADFLRIGDWNIICDRCGRKMKGSEARTTWQGYKVHSECWEPRHPQDFVRSVVENPEPPFVRQPADVFVATEDPIILEAALAPGDENNYILPETGVLWLSTEN